MINMFDLKAGDRVLLHGDTKAEVVENMEDGMWVQVITLDDDGKLAGEEPELVHAQDIVRVLPDTNA